MANLHYIPVHRHPYYESLGFKQGDFPNSEQFHKEAISLPVFPLLKIIQLRDEEKRVAFNDAGYIVIEIWEHDWIKAGRKPSYVYELIKQAIKKRLQNAEYTN